MMLDLFICQSQGALPSVTSLCIAACVPPTTSLRWIAKLTDAGLFQRQGDPFDLRRSHVSFTDYGYKTMEELLRTAMETAR